LLGGSAVNIKKFNYLSGKGDQKEDKIRLSKMKKLQEDIKTLNRSSIKSGNFVMPKIFDINLQLNDERAFERRALAYNLSRFEQ
jgi:hypothetical protein